MDLSIIIVSHHHDRFIKGCLESLKDHLVGVSHEIILVDNVGSAPLKSELELNFPEVKLLVNSRVQGFSKNCNKGYGASTGRYVLFLNPDTRILKGDFAEFLQRVDNIPDIGIACGQLLNGDLSPQRTIRRFPTFHAVLSRGFEIERLIGLTKAQKMYLMEGENMSEQREIDWCAGAFIMVHRELFEKVGKFDESFFMYYEDIDLCYRLRELGKKNIFFPEMQIVHYYQRESARKIINKNKVWHIESILRFFWKHKYLFQPGV